MSKTGIEKLVYKATGGDITIPGEKLAADAAPVIEKLTGTTARGTNRRTGNKRFDATFTYLDDDILTALEADEGNLNDLEIWMLGSIAADHTIPAIDLIATERIDADPESETGGGLDIQAFRVWNG